MPIRTKHRSDPVIVSDITPLMSPGRRFNRMSPRQCVPERFICQWMVWQLSHSICRYTSAFVPRRPTTRPFIRWLRSGLR